ncbi:hypothetical protein BASA50_010712 [Batrachochytrium salamandrivorans]|uniref:Pentacotripeptide-repeat region of PRORP domain-containing protein n=1 Tax=Batrachochytrium salamandrivorans TaxID=1357716 RepID=A0ABQ8EXP1_9FUNG|nr:hypothetical protein BASA50_010712 [Batrachochytrium salamandrivorans]
MAMMMRQWSMAVMGNAATSSPAVLCAMVAQADMMAGQRTTRTGVVVQPRLMTRLASTQSIATESSSTTATPPIRTTATTTATTTRATASIQTVSQTGTKDNTTPEIFVKTPPLSNYKMLRSLHPHKPSSNGTHKSPLPTSLEEASTAGAATAAEDQSLVLATISKLKHALDVKNRQLALELYTQLQQIETNLLETLPPRYYTLLIMYGYDVSKRSVLFKTLEERCNLIEQIILTMDRVGVKVETGSLNIALHAYLSLQDSVRAEDIVKRLEKRGVKSKSELLLGQLCQAHIIRGQDNEGIKYFTQLRKVDLTQRPYLLLIKGYAQRGCEEGVLSVLEMMNAAKFKVKAELIEIVCSMYVQSGEKDMVRTIVKQFKQGGGIINKKPQKSSVMGAMSNG